MGPGLKTGAFFLNAEGGGRTHTPVKELDFESSASACSATSAYSANNPFITIIRSVDKDPQEIPCCNMKN